MNSGEASSAAAAKPENPVSEQERELARNAQLEFARGEYAACAAHLAKLEQLRPHDLKVAHNRLLAEYHRSNEPSRTEHLAKGLGSLGANAEPDSVDRAVLMYNQALILYHTAQYQAALDIANTLFSLIEPMEESLVHKVCLLLVELHLMLGRPDTALALVNYIESQFLSTAESLKNALGEQTPNQKADPLIKPPARTPTAVPTEKEQKKDSMDIATDAFRIKLLKCKLRIYLRTLQLKLCKREWKTLVSLGMPTNISTIFLKANLEYLRKNFKKSMKLLDSIDSKTCPSFKACGESIAVLYYNNMASLHFAMGKPNLACFYLGMALEENQKALNSLKSPDSASNSVETPPPLHALGKNKHHELMYSLGVSFLHTGQAMKAFDCFIEAAQHLHNNSRLWLRMAECCIICHKPTNRIDFDIPARRRDIVEKIVGENNGNGISRKFVLANSLSKNCKYNQEGLSYAIPQPTLEYGMLCLKNALFLLPTTNCDENNLPVANLQVDEGAKKMMMGHQQQSSLLGSLSSPNAHKLGNNINPSPNTNQNSTQITQSSATVIENLNLKISILTASAYVSLCLGDYVMALNHAKALLLIKKLPGAHWLLGNLYAAESLIFLDRFYEALEYLKPENLQDVSTYIPIMEVVGDKDKLMEEVIEQKPSKVTWYPSNVPTAKSILRYDLAVAYAIRGELDKSGEILKQVWTSKGPDCDIPIHVIMLALYIELQLGHVDVARSLIKQHYCMVQQ
ncbi:hypothetical protein QAD02_015048 [Eretmocerus hayati]|uniref:Uncharacterized protein n=1 Tax=Eretmocerus hayati TaxID=131215 RepID=A0ACC2P8E6_9HYME|nr:hypothetical protein QAD02_015048 [Eretmocerus hayati]